MAQVKKRIAKQKPKGYQVVDTDGKLFRVRDKDYSDGQPVKIWGENLTYDAAHLLKEKVTGSKKSRTARIEEMSLALPSADPTLEAVRQRGLSAGRGAASAAQVRADQLALRRRQEAKAASAPKPTRPPPPRILPKPIAMDMNDTDLDAPDVEEEGDVEETADVASVEAGVDDDINEYEQRGKELYESYMLAVWGSGASWEKLSPKDQAAFSFEATAEQGPHIDALRAVAAPPAEDVSSNGSTSTTSS